MKILMDNGGSMLKPKKKESRLDVYTKALLLIESEVEHACFEDRYTKEQMCNLVYELAHSALTQHTKGCKHPEWDKKLNEMFESSVKAELFSSVKEFKKGLKKGVK